jgi:hypothetical protein
MPATRDKTRVWRSGGCVASSSSPSRAPRDCRHAPAAGVSLDITPNAGTTGFYFTDTLPSLTATQTDAVNGYAAGGFFNVVAGPPVTLRAKVAENALAYSPATLFTRAGAMSYVFLYAGPP